MTTGLKINFNKSFLYSWGNDAIESVHWANLLGFKVGSIPFTYLGAPIGADPRKKEFWYSLTQKMDTKLASWKCTSLNEADRSTLIKSTLNNMPIYWFSLFKIPIGICKELEKKRRAFYWKELSEDNGGKRKLHSVKWSALCQPKNKGGLGLGVLQAKNSAMLSKWWWRWIVERHKP